MGSTTSAPAPAPAAPSPTKADPIIIRRGNRTQTLWEIFQFIVVVAVSAVVPLRIGFALTSWRSWVAVDVVTDLAFWANIAATSITTFLVDGEEVVDPALIRRQYLTSWQFWLDLVSVLPTELIAIGVQRYTPIYRVNRLLRVVYIPSFFRMWERDSSLKPTIVRLLRSAFVFFFYTHYIGCALYLILNIEDENVLPDFFPSPIRTLQSEYTFASQYVRSWFWAALVMPGFSNANPSTLLEVVFLMFVTVSGIMFLALVIGEAGSLATNLDSSKIYFRSKMDEVEDYMVYKKLPSELMQDVRTYYKYLWQSGKALEKNDLLQDLPQYLKHKMSVFLNGQIIAKVPMFKECNEDFISAIVERLKALVCLPNFFVVRKGEVGTEMFFISRGELNVVTDEGVVVFTLKDGGFFGEIALLYDTKRTATIVARTYCDMFVLTKDDFKKVMNAFPDQSKGIKKIAQERFQKIIDDEKKKEAAAAEATKKEVTSLMMSSEDPAELRKEVPFAALASESTSLFQERSVVYSPHSSNLMNDVSGAFTSGGSVTPNSKRPPLTTFVPAPGELQHQNSLPSSLEDSTNAVPAGVSHRTSNRNFSVVIHEGYDEDTFFIQPPVPAASSCLVPSKFSPPLPSYSPEEEAHPNEVADDAFQSSSRGTQPPTENQVVSVPSLFVEQRDAEDDRRKLLPAPGAHEMLQASGPYLGASPPPPRRLTATPGGEQTSEEDSAVNRLPCSPPQPSMIVQQEEKVSQQPSEEDEGEDDGQIAEPEQSLPHLLS